jgi:hypothetical protein
VRLVEERNGIGGSWRRRPRRAKETQSHTKMRHSSENRPSVAPPGSRSATPGKIGKKDPDQSCRDWAIPRFPKLLDGKASKHTVGKSGWQTKNDILEPVLRCTRGGQAGQAEIIARWRNCHYLTMSRLSCGVAPSGQMPHLKTEMNFV